MKKHFLAILALLAIGGFVAYAEILDQWSMHPNERLNKRTKETDHVARIFSGN